MKNIIGYCFLSLENLTPNSISNVRRDEIVCVKGLLYKVVSTVDDTHDTSTIELDSLCDSGVLRKCELSHDTRLDRYQFVKWID